MGYTEDFKTFNTNLNIPLEARSRISTRYKNITKRLNIDYWDSESDILHSKYVGSYGRRTAISGFSDMDMLFVLPESVYKKYNSYANNGQSALLQSIKKSLEKTYRSTFVRGDGQVVAINFTDGISFEIVPCFENEDGSFTYPDSNDGGKWRITKPRPEIDEISSMDINKNGNLKYLCKISRAWKNKHAVVIGGLLIDTLSHRFLSSTSDYDSTGFGSHPYMITDFLKYLADEPEKSFYLAVGSNQRIDVKKNFQAKANKAYKLCLEALACDSDKAANKMWKKVFGRPFPTLISKSEAATKRLNWDDTEEFIEDKFPVDIRYGVTIDCTVSQNGFRENSLGAMLIKRIPLLASKKLRFFVVKNDTPEPFEVYWKILNRGEIAQNKNMIRGQIVQDTGSLVKNEQTRFRGHHLCECYIVKNNVVVAKDRIDVPIMSDEESS